MRLTKEEFCSTLSKLKKISKENETLSDALGINEWIGDDWYYSFYDFFVKMCDIGVDDLNDIDYFCLELDYGRKYKPGVYKIDGEDIPLRTFEDLWNLLMRGEGEEK